MRLVQPDYPAGTYLGPWAFPNDGTIPEGLITEAEALQAGLKQFQPPDPVPVSVPKWAFLMVLRRSGKETALKAAITAYSGPNADRVRAKWDADPEIERNGATINALGAAIGYTPEQVDQVFRDADKEANQ